MPTAGSMSSLRPLQGSCNLPATTAGVVSARKGVALVPGSAARTGSSATRDHARRSTRPCSGAVGTATCTSRWIGEEGDLLVQADLIPPLALGAVEGLVGGADQLLRAGHQPRGVSGHPEAGGESDGPS